MTTVYTSSLLMTAAFLLFKGYFLCVVWKCYRYLKIKEMILPLHLHHPYTTAGNDLVMPASFLSPMTNLPPPGAFVAPPDYETATKNNAPPDYEAACRAADLAADDSKLDPKQEQLQNETSVQEMLPVATTTSVTVTTVPGQMV